ncbi:hypothetical protein C5C18_03795 [Rathayibacter tritici]|nr:hypothetical protein C5C06_00505 [Rathayibacter tritici]PPF70237.1 hypothetical protein C5C21_01345 [Rathayibacter tritici]PPG08520.1 hypothetical protein C5C18_03795 [Rathayibacter tritici]PPI13067.1 hypothetical protein C5D07_11175 [Rathayibacter tritici]
MVGILARSHRPAGIRIVGGAAIAFWFGDRRLTDDVDARLTPAEDIRRAAAVVARKRGWPLLWLNPDASIFSPDYGETVEWTTIHSANDIVVEIASTRALLAMKLRASRPGRDDDDIARLLALHRIASVEEAAEVHRSFYPGDELTDRALLLLEDILSAGVPALHVLTLPTMDRVGNTADENQ